MKQQKDRIIWPAKANSSFVICFPKISTVQLWEEQGDENTHRLKCLLGVEDQSIAGNAESLWLEIRKSIS